MDQGDLQKSKTYQEKFYQNHKGTKFKISVYWQSHTGKRRKENQDNYSIAETDNSLLFTVADGMGGAKGGAYASALVSKYYPYSAFTDNYYPLKEDIVTALKDVNRGVHILSHRYPELEGMGSTVVSLYFSQDSSFVAHVGDSRLYRLRNGQIDRLTKDHTVVQELIDSGSINDLSAKHPFSHMLSRSLGPVDAVEPEVNSLDFISGDIFILCTDGLYNHASDNRLNELFGNLGFEDLCGGLVDEALNEGGTDNVTVMVLKVEQTSEEFAQKSNNLILSRTISLDLQDEIFPISNIRVLDEVVRSDISELLPLVSGSKFHSIKGIEQSSNVIFSNDKLSSLDLGEIAERRAGRVTSGLFAVSVLAILFVIGFKYDFLKDDSSSPELVASIAKKLASEHTIETSSTKGAKTKEVLIDIPEDDISFPPFPKRIELITFLDSDQIVEYKNIIDGYRKRSVIEVDQVDIDTIPFKEAPAWLSLIEKLNLYRAELEFNQLKYGLVSASDQHEKELIKREIVDRNDKYLEIIEDINQSIREVDHKLRVLSVFKDTIPGRGYKKMLDEVALSNPILKQAIIDMGDLESKYVDLYQSAMMFGFKQTDLNNHLNLAVRNVKDSKIRVRSLFLATVNDREDNFKEVKNELKFIKDIYNLELTKLNKMVTIINLYQAPQSKVKEAATLRAERAILVQKVGQIEDFVTEQIELNLRRASLKN